jgi:hypothetical protein
MIGILKALGATNYSENIFIQFSLFVEDLGNLVVFHCCFQQF